MRFYGNLIAQVAGHTKNSPNLIDRIVVVYATKTKVKMYLFDATYMYWQKKCHLIDMVEVTINGSIDDIITEQLEFFSTKHKIKFRKNFYKVQN